MGSQEEDQQPTMQNSRRILRIFCSIALAIMPTVVQTFTSQHSSIIQATLHVEHMSNTTATLLLTSTTFDHDRYTIVTKWNWNNNHYYVVDLDNITVTSLD